MVCKLCGKEEKLVKSHIIPKSFFMDLKGKGPKNHFKIHSNVKGERPKRSQTGTYDKLVCEDCEKIFSPWDDYAKKFLLQELSENTFIKEGGKLFGYQLKDFSYHNLKLFFISVLWRASVSTRKEFSDVNVGPFKSQLEEMINNSDSGDPNAFSVILSKFDEPLGKIILYPHKRKFAGINYILFYIAGFTACVKVDSRSAKDPFDYFILKPEQQLIIIARNLSDSPELKLMKKIARKWQ